jgi:mannose-1-phosphate guanylyltransferase / mannose-6-phosphate isomerase
MRAIILAGGSGRRLWPLSTQALPKQFLDLEGGATLLQKTAQRLLPSFKIEEFLIVTSAEYAPLVQKQLKEVKEGLEKQILIEPSSRNSAPALALALLHLQDKQGMSSSECVLVASSDHSLSDESAFLSSLKAAEPLAQKGFHLLFGVEPTKPETRFGYIKTKRGIGASLVLEFVEKPDLAIAQQFIQSGDYLWNAGIFVFQSGAFFSDLARTCPDIASHCSTFDKLQEAFVALPSLSIDKALLEKTQNALVLPLAGKWADLGSWENLYEALAKDENQNVKRGDVVDIDTTNCLIVGGKRVISTIGVDQLLIVETQDALVVCRRDQSHRLDEILQKLKERNGQ